MLSANEGILRQLRRLLDTGRLVHAFLFFGGTHESRVGLANEFREMLIPEHPEDFIPVSRQANKAGIGTDDIESLQEKLKYKPYGERYAVVIEEAQLMGPAAQNKLLKTLEEPVSPAVIILLSPQKEVLLPTVLSRCSCYQLADAKPAEDPAIGSAADVMLTLTLQGAPFYKKKNALSAILGDREGQREKALAFLDAFERRLLAQAQSGPSDKIMTAAEQTCEARRAVRQLHNAGYALKQLCLRI